jgi:CDGSH-type Zn-finger protein
MSSPNIIQKKPVIIELEEGKQYGWCACGLSKNEGGAFCDGSHKTTEFKPHIFKAEEHKKVAICMCKHTKNRPFCDGTHAKL